MVPALLTIACSASDPVAPASCQIIGTYGLKDTMTDGDCPPPTGATVAVTISSDGAVGYIIQYEGLTGGCPAEIVAGCKIQGKCDLIVKDPIDPMKATGSLQFSWSFDAAGYSGVDSFAFPPAKAIAKGCHSDYSASANRR